MVDMTQLTAIHGSAKTAQRVKNRRRSETRLQIYGIGAILLAALALVALLWSVFAIAGVLIFSCFFDSGVVSIFGIKFQPTLSETIEHLKIYILAITRILCIPLENILRLTTLINQIRRLLGFELCLLLNQLRPPLITFQGNKIVGEDSKRML